MPESYAPVPHYCTELDSSCSNLVFGSQKDQQQAVLLY